MADPLRIGRLVKCITSGNARKRSEGAGGMLYIIEVQPAIAVPAVLSCRARIAAISSLLDTPHAATGAAIIERLAKGGADNVAAILSAAPHTIELLYKSLTPAPRSGADSLPLEQHAVSALFILAKGSLDSGGTPVACAAVASDPACQAVKQAAQQHGCGPLVRLLAPPAHGGDGLAVHRALMLLCMLSGASDAFRAAIIEAGAVPRLVQLIGAATPSPGDLGDAADISTLALRVTAELLLEGEAAPGAVTEPAAHQPAGPAPGTASSMAVQQLAAAGGHWAIVAALRSGWPGAERRVEAAASLASILAAKEAAVQHRLLKKLARAGGRRYCGCRLQLASLCTSEACPSCCSRACLFQLIRPEEPAFVALIAGVVPALLERLRSSSPSAAIKCDSLAALKQLTAFDSTARAALAQQPGAVALIAPFLRLEPGAAGAQNSGDAAALIANMVAGGCSAELVAGLAAARVPAALAELVERARSAGGGEEVLVQEAALLGLANMAACGDELRLEAACCLAPQLAGLLRSPSGQVRAAAARAVHSLTSTAVAPAPEGSAAAPAGSTCRECCEIVVAAGVVAPLLELLAQGSPLAQAEAVGCLANIAAAECAQPTASAATGAFLAAGGPQQLAALLALPEAAASIELPRDACMLVASISCPGQAAYAPGAPPALLQAGLLPMLAGLQGRPDISVAAIAALGCLALGASAAGMAAEVAEAIEALAQPLLQLDRSAAEYGAAAVALAQLALEGAAALAALPAQRLAQLLAQRDGPASPGMLKAQLAALLLCALSASGGQPALGRQLLEAGLVAPLARCLLAQPDNELFGQVLEAIAQATEGGAPVGQLLQRASGLSGQELETAQRLADPGRVAGLTGGQELLSRSGEGAGLRCMRLLWAGEQGSLPLQGSKSAAAGTSGVEVRRCAVCRRAEGAGGVGGVARLMRCSRCRETLYCGADCQRAHWPEHKASCVAPAAAARPNEARGEEARQGR
jgi:hypothetical protein